MTNSTEEWISRLAREFPTIDFDRHGTLGYRWLMSQVIRQLVAALSTGDRQSVFEFVSRVKFDYSSLDRLSQRVAVFAFARALPWPDEEGSEMADWLGPILRSEYDRAHHDGLGPAEWIAGLMDDYPGLRLVYQMEIEDEESLLLVAMARWVVGVYDNGDVETARAFVGRVAADYPRLGGPAQDLVDDSFIEMLPSRGEHGGWEISEWLGPALLEVYERSH